MRTFLLSASVAMLFFSSIPAQALKEDVIPGSEEAAAVRFPVVQLPVQQHPAQQPYQYLPLALYQQAEQYQAAPRDLRAENIMRQDFLSAGGQWR